MRCIMKGMYKILGLSLMLGLVSCSGGGSSSSTAGGSSSSTAGGSSSSTADTTAPVITILGFNPASVPQGMVYSDAGATATDNVDGDITANIMATNTVNTSTLGNYTVTYDVSDAAGNAATTQTRQVAVVPLFGTKQLGVAGALTFAQSVATDVSGNVYVAGYTNGGLDGNTLTGGRDFFLTKYNASGVKQFTKQLGVAGALTFAQSVATDASGNVYVAGYTYGGLDGNTLTGTADFFVTKYNASGVKQFTKQLGVAGVFTSAQSVATDASGNVYVAGYTNGGLDGNTLTGAQDFFVTKYNASGVKQFTKQLGVAGAATDGQSVATDASGNVYVAGSTNGGLDGNALTGTIDFFVTKYDASGVKQFTKQLGVAGTSTFGQSVATDASGNVYVAGYTYGGLDGNTKTGSSDFFVTKYNASGVKQFTKQLGVAGTLTYGQSVATDASGNVYVAGATYGGLDGNTLTGITDFFVTKYNASGVKQFTKQLGVAGTRTSGQSVATDASGNVYVAGSTNGGLDGNTLAGTKDFFVTKFGPSGAKY